ncbi:hypothetical protein BJ970_000831 [Saccharopolyspora phatthalungensis]|uniref:Helix-turn-helix domain-containing protein n=2 Tax=Saccharopolyspora phatthalungensis TaxID=664693 RepID=A0A840PZX8_9PSEU|nr:hypothetical protein [Saccharopolyspora phatthalungensis]
MRKVQRGARVTGHAREKLAADLKRWYDRETSIRQLVEVSGRSYGAVRLLLQEAGAEFRPPGAPSKTAANPTPQRPEPILSRVAL